MPLTLRCPSLMRACLIALAAWSHLASLTAAAGTPCPVAAPSDGVLGGCPPSLADGGRCSVACRFGFVVSAAQTVCSDGTLEGQTCVPVGCPGGSAGTLALSEQRLSPQSRDNATTGEGYALSLSADALTLVTGAPYRALDAPGGQAIVYTRPSPHSPWVPVPQAHLIPSDATTSAGAGFSVSISAAGDLVAIGGPANNGAGASWVFARADDGKWTQVGSSLVGTSIIAIAGSSQGQSVSLAADGMTLAVGGHMDDSGVGAVWMWTRRSDGTFTQLGEKLVPSGIIGYGALVGYSVALSADGAVLAAGGPADSVTLGAVWVWERVGGMGSGYAQATKLVGAVSDEQPRLANQGYAVAIDAAGTVVATGAPEDDGRAGGVYIFRRQAGGAWRQQGGKLLPAGYPPNQNQGFSVALTVSFDGFLLATGTPVEDADLGSVAMWHIPASADPVLQPRMLGQKLRSATDQGEQPRFGMALALALNGTYVAVGRPYTSEGGMVLGQLHTVCAVCAEGRSCAGGDAAAVTCPPGTFCPANSTTPALCELGTWSSTVGAVNSSTCVACSNTGVFCAAGSRAQTLCAVGHYCPNATSQLSCATPGDYCAVPGLTSPLLCPPGHWCPNATVQTSCTPGHVNPDSGGFTAAACVACPAGSSTLNQANSTSCTPCAQFEWQLLAGQPTCTRCPPASTYWQGPNQCVQCESAGCLGTDQCALGYEGILCSQCGGNFFRETGGPSGAQFSCLACGGNSGWVAPVILIVLLIAAVLFIKLSSSPLGRAVLPPLLIGVSYSQLLSFTRLVKLGWSSEASSALSVTSLTALNLQALSEASCFISYDTSFWVTLAFPLGVAALLLMARGAFQLLPRQRVAAAPVSAEEVAKAQAEAGDEIEAAEVQLEAIEQQEGSSSVIAAVVPAGGAASDGCESESESASASSRCACCTRLLLRVSSNLRVHTLSECNLLLQRSFLSVLVFAYPFLAWQALQIADCPLLAGERRLRENAAVVCGSAQWAHYLVAAVLGGVVYVIGIPLLLLFILRQPDTATLYLTSLQSLKPTARWWLVGQEVWKLAAVLSLRLLLESPETQVALFAVLLALRTAAVLYFQPHADPWHNREESALAGCSVVVLLLGVAFFARGAGISSEGSTLLVVLVALALASMGGVVIGCVYRSARNMVQSQRHKRRMSQLRDEAAHTHTHAGSADSRARVASEVHIELGEVGGDAAAAAAAAAAPLDGGPGDLVSPSRVAPPPQASPRLLRGSGDGQMQ